MGWKEEEAKRIVADGVERRERLRLRQKKANQIFAIVALIGAIVLVIDVLTRDDGAMLPMDLGDPVGTVAQWRSSGFVKSINDTAAVVVVDDAVWAGLSEDEKTSVVAFLCSYCEEARHLEGAGVQIKGHSSSALLAAMASSGTMIR